MLQGRGPLPRHRPHRPMEQDHRAARHAQPGLHAEAAVHRQELRGEQAPVRGLQLREALPGRPLPRRVQRPQPAAGQPGAGPPQQDARHRPREADQRGRGAAAPLHQRVVRRDGGERAAAGSLGPLRGRARPDGGAVEGADLQGGGRLRAHTQPPHGRLAPGAQPPARTQQQLFQGGGDEIQTEIR